MKIGDYATAQRSVMGAASAFHSQQQSPTNALARAATNDGNMEKQIVKSLLELHRWRLCPEAWMQKPGIMSVICTGNELSDHKQALVLAKRAAPSSPISARCQNSFCLLHLPKA